MLGFKGLVIGLVDVQGWAIRWLAWPASPMFRVGVRREAWPPGRAIHRPDRPISPPDHQWRGLTLQAECYRRHRAPASDCRCGIYAVRYLEQARIYAYSIAAVLVGRSSARRWRALADPVSQNTWEHIMALVDGDSAGRDDGFIPASRGWRAARARIVAFVYPPRKWSVSERTYRAACRIVEQAADRWGVPAVEPSLAQAWVDAQEWQEE
jgi:hypothetical protein